MILILELSFLLVLKLKKSCSDQALEHIEKLGDTDIFPLAFEYKAIRQGAPLVRASLSDVLRRPRISYLIPLCHGLPVGREENEKSPTKRHGLAGYPFPEQDVREAELHMM